VPPHKHTTVFFGKSPTILDCELILGDCLLINQPKTDIVKARWTHQHTVSIICISTFGFGFSFGLGLGYIKLALPLLGYKSKLLTFGLTKTLLWGQVPQGSRGIETRL
jgi:hypothetical protein